MKARLIRAGLTLFLVLFAASVWTSGSGSNAHDTGQKDKTVQWKSPESLQAEHEELHAQLAKATQAGGKTGEAARAVAKVLHPHFEKEGEYALPPLGLLPLLAAGKVTPEMEQVIALTDTLKTELPQMLQEHKAIVAALETLIDAAREEGKPEHAVFAENLIAHARTEEEVLYPAAIVIGEYLKLRLRK